VSLEADGDVAVMLQCEWRDVRRDAREQSWLRLGVPTLFEVNTLNRLFLELRRLSKAYAPLIALSKISSQAQQHSKTFVK
jgi:hypothetical protein